jgi:Cu2+-exporting ATPase
VRLRVPRLAWDPEYGDRAATHLARQPGVLQARANAACSSLVVEYDPARAGLIRIGAWLAEAAALPREAGARERRRVPESAGSGALVCGAASLALSLAGAPLIVTGALITASAAPIVGRAIGYLFGQGRVSVDLLDSTAIGVLALRGDVTSAAVAASLIAGGEVIRALTARRSRDAVVGLLSLGSREVWVVRGRRKERIPTDSLTEGDTVVVYAGEMIQVDGVVLRGRAMVDQKALTGESAPVLKTAGDAVFASTVVADGKLYVRAERVGDDTRAHRIVQLLEDAPAQDTRMADHARAFADRLVLPTLLLGGAMLSLTGDVARAASIVIFDFATGIRISAPTTVLATMTAAARHDILIKGGRAIEQLTQVDTLVFDKTGTLTTGVADVTDVLPLAPGVSADEMLALAAAAEQRLSHPAAQAIVRAAEQRGLQLAERGESHVAIGLGVEADVEGRAVLVGSERFLGAREIAMPDEARQIVAQVDRGVSSILVAVDGRLVGAIRYADATRPEAAAVLASLRARGVRRIVMMTGDSEAVAREVAREVGIDEVEAGVFPERKAEVVRALQAAGYVVGVIGDGINDSPALAYADVSFSLKEGTDVARETADVVLHGDLRGLVDSIDLARDSMRLLRENLAIVAVPNAAGMLLATLGAVGPLVATALNNGSAVAAAVNGLRPLMAESAPSRAEPLARGRQGRAG